MIFHSIVILELISITEKNPSFYFHLFDSSPDKATTEELNDNDLVLSYENVVEIASLPLHCLDREYPYKLRQAVRWYEETLIIQVKSVFSISYRPTPHL